MSPGPWSRSLTRSPDAAIHDLVAHLDPGDAHAVRAAGAQARALVTLAAMPGWLTTEIADAYAELSRRCGTAEVAVAVRSSATCEDQPDIGLSQYNTRHYVIPPAKGVDLRFLNGYMYLTPVAVADPAEVESRVPEFLERAGYYFQNWDRLYDAWLPKVRTLIDELEAIRFDPLPEREEMAVITEGRGTGSALTLLSTYHRLVDLTMTLWQYHFEFLNLGYAAYLDFFGFCKG
ncbi:MAG: PEP/pyruvate-binding domain-containing protein, partial [Kineosporiaceae bacterium]